MSESTRQSGIYRILGEGAELGTEAWSEQVSGAGVRLASVVMRQAPTPLEEEIDLELDAAWRPVRLTVERSSPLGDRRYVGRRVGDAWISQIFREQGPLKTVTLSWGPETHLDYFTPHTNRITIRRLGLAEGESRVIEVIFVDPDAFTPSVVRQTYTRLPDPAPETIAGRVAAQRYLYESMSGFQSRILVDRDGVILRYDDLFESIET